MLKEIKDAIEGHKTKFRKENLIRKKKKKICYQKKENQKKEKENIIRKRQEKIGIISERKKINNREENGKADRRG